MYGWRGRIGVVVPADNSVTEIDFHRLAPVGVSAHALRLPRLPREEMGAHAVTMVGDLLYSRFDVLTYMCAASSFLLGVDGNVALQRSLAAAIGDKPVSTTSTVMVDALRAIGAKRVSVIAPYREPIVEALCAFLEASGVEVGAVRGLGLDAVDINETGPEAVYQAVRAADRRGCDAILVPATNLRALDVVDACEADFGLPMITSNQASYWWALQALGVHGSIEGFGSLLRDRVDATP